MEKDISILAKIAFIDKILDDFEDELGDLPKSVKTKEANVSDIKTKIAETEQIMNDVRVFVATAKSTLVALKEKEDKLSQQQFLVRNNKEFDAITGEIKLLKDEHEKLSVKMRTEGMKESNLLLILEGQKQELDKAITELNELNRQFDEMSTEQSDEVQIYNRIRKKLRLLVNDSLYDKYATIRTRNNDAAVTLKKDSCMGCYRSIPQQLIVEMRNQVDRIFQCENCGRILIPDWVEIDEEEIEKLDK
jgi:predicted  nucleic acid-binding Zn-ribbon protein